jgi:hypothetical protein
MKNRIILTGVLSALAFTGVANAQNGSGTLGVTANVQGSINLTFVTDASGVALTGTGTSTASMPLGTVSMYGGTVPGNVTKTAFGTTSFSLSTPFDVRVDVANSATTTYTLNATLSTADAINIWTVGGFNISSGAQFALTAAGVYATNTAYLFVLNVPATATAGAITNVINFSAVGA